MRRWIVMAAALLLMGAGPAPRVEDLAWMAGDRSQARMGGSVREVWIGPEGGMLLGMNLTTKSRQMANWEFMRIGPMADGRLAFFAHPAGQPAATFPLKSLEGERVVFEDPAHDFPQRVIYWRKPDGAIGARIEGVMDG